MSDQSDAYAPFPPRRDQRSIGTLISDLARLSGLLIRQETALLKAEMTEHVGQLGAGARLMIAGGVLAFAGLLYLLAAAMLALALVVDPWLAALIVGLVVLALGGGLVWIGRRSFRTDRLAPQRTLRSLKDDAEWLRGQMR